MKIVLVFACLAIPMVSAGIGVVTPEIEAEAERIWKQYCVNQEGGNLGDVTIHCKSSNDVVTEKYEHEVTVTPKPNQKRQIVFVRPPSYEYKHRVVVTGGGSSGQKTVIYVLPNKNKNVVNVEDRTNNKVVTQKPTVFYLKKDHGSTHDDNHSSLSPPPVGGYEDSVGEGYDEAVGGYEEPSPTLDRVNVNKPMVLFLRQDPSLRRQTDQLNSNRRAVLVLPPRHHRAAAADEEEEVDSKKK